MGTEDADAWESVGIRNPNRAAALAKRGVGPKTYKLAESLNGVNVTHQVTERFTAGELVDILNEVDLEMDNSMEDPSAWS